MADNPMKKIWQIIKGKTLPCFSLLCIALALIVIFPAIMWVVSFLAAHSLFKPFFVEGFLGDFVMEKGGVKEIISIFYDDIWCQIPSLIHVTTIAILIIAIYRNHPKRKQVVYCDSRCFSLRYG